MIKLGVAIGRDGKEEKNVQLCYFQFTKHICIQVEIWGKIEERIF